MRQNDATASGSFIASAAPSAVRLRAHVLPRVRFDALIVSLSHEMVPIIQILIECPELEQRTHFLRIQL